MFAKNLYMVSWILNFATNPYGRGGDNNNHNNHNNNNAVLVARGGGEIQIPAICQGLSGTGEKETHYINVVGKNNNREKYNIREKYNNREEKQ